MENKMVFQKIRLEIVKDHTYDWLPKLHSPEDAYNLIKCVMPEMLASDKEMMVVLGLSPNNLPHICAVVSMGMADITGSSPREIFKLLLISNSTRFILVHNHPGGDPTPSDIDIGNCKKVYEASKILDVEMLDSIIVTPENFASMSAVEKSNGIPAELKIFPDISKHQVQPGAAVNDKSAE